MDLLLFTAMFSLQRMAPEGVLTLPSATEEEIFTSTIALLEESSFSKVLEELRKTKHVFTVTIDAQIQWPATIDFQRRKFSFRKDLFESIQNLAPYLAFELYNYNAQGLFQCADRLKNSAKIEKEDYIELIERIEYSTALKTSLIVDELIKKNRLDSKHAIAFQKVAPNFAEHLTIQKKAGHSSLIKF